MKHRTCRQSQHQTSRSAIRRFLPLALAACLTFLVAGSAAANQWIHLRVESQNDETVTVNLPVSLMRAAVAMIPAEAREEMTLEFENDIELDWYELRALWDEVRSAPEATFVTVQTRDEHIAVRKQGDFVTVQTIESNEHGAQVDMKMPIQVIDALLSGPRNTFDFEAAIDALILYAPDQLITVKDGEDRVEIWIDEIAEAE